MKKKILIAVICIIIAVVLVIVAFRVSFAITRKNNETNLNNNTAQENKVNENKSVENTTVENKSEDENTIIENKVADDNKNITDKVVPANQSAPTTGTSVAPSSVVYESTDIGSTDKKQQAIELVKKQWGEDDTVSFRCDSVTSEGEYIIAVTSSESASVKNYFRVNINTKTVEVDY